MEVGMERSMFGRWAAALGLGLVGASLAFVAGMRCGEALNGRVNGLTFANTPIPSAPAAVAVPVARK